MLHSIDTCTYFYKNETVDAGLLEKRKNEKTFFFSPEKEIRVFRIHQNTSRNGPWQTIKIKITIFLNLTMFEKATTTMGEKNCTEDQIYGTE
jgi:hypothetical protein